MSKNQEYVKQYAEYAMEQMRRYGIPASVTLAQGICESSNGRSELSRKGNNHFGIKATGTWIKDGGQYLVYTDDKPNEKFCKYENVGDSYEHHSKFLVENKRYANLFQLSPDDYKGWTQGLQSAGYASSKTYASTLNSIIESNNLQKYDQMVMQEMKETGKKFGVDVSEGVSKKTGVSNYSFPLKRSEFMLVTSPFGNRKDPMDNTKQQMHKGIDIQTRHEPVLATEDNGKVIKTNENVNTAGGKSVTVEYDRNDGSKYQCTYMHLDSISVKEGDTVKAGQTLGMSGNTGTRTTGEHLHFGVKAICSDGVSRDIDPGAYLAEIAQRGNIKLQALHNGKDITAQYKANLGLDNNSHVAEQTLGPDEWMKKLLSSEDSGVDMGHGDPIIEIMMSMFTSLMALALQIDNKSESEKMQNVTDAAINKRIDLTSFFPNFKYCNIEVQGEKPIVNVDNGHISFSHELTNAEQTKLHQVLNNDNVSEEDKRRGIASIVNNIVLSKQLSQNYQNSVDNNRQQESIQLK